MISIKEAAAEAKASLSDEIRTLIGQANHDLYNGPSGNDENYPGFTTACRVIRNALADIPSSTVCDDDTGEGVEIDRASLVFAIVGRELAPYVR